MPTSSVSTRRDAVRNRDRILRVARAALADGESLQLNAVARRAEVGVGTVYRHFATPEELGEALAEQRFIELVASARDAAHADDSVAALRGFLGEALAQFAADAVFAEASVNPTPVREQTAELRAELIGSLALLVERVAAEGRVRDGLEADDVLLLLCGVGYSVRVARGRPAASGYLDAVLDGVLR